jgi:glycosyl transferase family 87
MEQRKNPRRRKRLRKMTITPARRLLGLGAIILVALVTCSRSSGGTGSPSFLAALFVAGVAYLVAIREFFYTAHYSRRVIFACLALAVLWRIPFLLMPPGADDDVRRYIWDGRIQRLGYNPYEVVPSDPALAALHTPETRGLNNPEVPSPYPAGAQLFFRAVTAIHESIFAFELSFVLCDFAIVLVLFSLLRRNGEAEHWVLAYAWHPLLATNVAGSGHIDILGVLLLLISVAALARRWRMTAAVAFALAVAVKFIPLVLVPLYWRRIRVRDALVATLVFVGLYLPFLKGWSISSWRIPLGSIGTFVQRFRFNDPIFGALQHVFSPQIVAGVALVAGLVTAAWFRRRNTQTNAADQWSWPMAASLLCAPVVYPWYLLWVLPFMRSVSTVPLIVWSISILPTYIVWYLRSRGYEWYVPNWALLLEYGSFALAAALVIFQRAPQIEQSPQSILPTKNTP